MKDEVKNLVHWFSTDLVSNQPGTHRQKVARGKSIEENKQREKSRRKNQWVKFTRTHTHATTSERNAFESDPAQRSSCYLSPWWSIKELTMTLIDRPTVMGRDERVRRRHSPLPLSRNSKLYLFDREISCKCPTLLDIAFYSYRNIFLESGEGKSFVRTHASMDDARHLTQ